MGIKRKGPPDAIADLVLLTPLDVSQMLRCSVQQVYKMMARLELGYAVVSRPGNRTRRMIPAGEVRRWIEAKMVKVMLGCAA